MMKKQVSQPLHKIGTIGKLELLIFGYAKVGNKNGLDYYIFQCEKHGKVVDYPHGRDEFLVCPKCDMERP